MSDLIKRAKKWILFNRAFYGSAWLKSKEIMEGLIEESEELQNQITKLEKVAQKLYKKTERNPEMWDTDGIRFLIDEALAELDN